MAHQRWEFVCLLDARGHCPPAKAGQRGGSRLGGAGPVSTSMHCSHASACASYWLVHIVSSEVMYPGGIEPGPRFYARECKLTLRLRVGRAA